MIFAMSFIFLLGVGQDNHLLCFCKVRCSDTVWLPVVSVGYQIQETGIRTLFLVGWLKRSLISSDVGRDGASSELWARQWILTMDQRFLFAHLIYWFSSHHRLAATRSHCPLGVPNISSLSQFGILHGLGMLLECGHDLDPIWWVSTGTVCRGTLKKMGDA